MMKLRHLLFILPVTFYFIIGCSSSKELKEGDRLTDQEMLQSGDELAAAGQYQQAIDMYQKMMLDYPTSDLHIQAQLKIAENYGLLEDYTKQMDALLTLLKENIIPREVPQIYVQVGHFYEQAARFNPGTVSNDTADYKTAIDYYRKAYDYKDSDDAAAKAKAGYRRALVEARIGQIDEAINHYKMVSETYPQSKYALLASVKLRNPQDFSELPDDDAAIEALRQEMNMPVQEGTVDSGQPLQEMAPAAEDSTGLERNFEPSVTDSTGLE